MNEDLREFVLLEAKETMAHLAALRTAYVMLARQLSRRGLVPLTDLAHDLETMSVVQADLAQQEFLAEIASALRDVSAIQTPPPQSRRPRRR